MCSDCGEQISGPYYTLENNEIVCAKDFKVNIETTIRRNYKVSQKRLGNCKKCGELVEGRIMKVSDMIYHPDCFCCVVN